jgi:hypothetical protein
VYTRAPVASAAAIPSISQSARRSEAALAIFEHGDRLPEAKLLH